jgi:hypothetical protein
VHHHSSNSCGFNFNTDLSGDVEITVQHLGLGRPNETTKVRGAALRSFMFAHLRSLREDHTDAEIMAMIVKGD